MDSSEVVADRYRLDERLGSGGMGVVWRAWDLALGRVVAVKHARPGEGEQRAEQLRREAKSAARVHHPNTVTLYDALVDERGECWLIMEYVEARSLADVLGSDGPLDAERVGRIGAQIADALAALHAGGVVHRDVKPGNVLVAPDGTAKLTDFGIARWSRTTLDETGPPAWTPAFGAPEVAMGRDATRASDVFSLGATLYAAATGDAPNDVAALSLPAPRSPLSAVITRLTAERPADRPTAAEAATMLRSGPARRRRRVRPVLVGGISVAAAAAVVAWALAPGAALTVARDPRTADPCGLADVADLGRYGRAGVHPEYGNFERCDVLIEVDGGTVDVRIQFEADQSDPRSGAVAVPEGGPTVHRDPPDSRECTRTIPLTAPFGLAITAKTSAATADLCAIADSATATAAARLASAGVPVRSAPFDPASLANADACALLDGRALARIPGIDATGPEVGFGNWHCRWHSTTDPVSLIVRFDRNEPLTAQDGRPTRLGGHDAVIAPDDREGACEVRVVHRTYLAFNRRPTSELVLVTLIGEGPAEGLCATAAELASVAAGSLPTP